MKKLILSIALYFAAVTLPAQAQSEKSPTQLNVFLTYYFNIKDALVNDDASEAQTQGAGFVNALNEVNEGGLSVKEHQAFMKHNKALEKNAVAMAATKNISKQREYFALLSETVFQFAKELNIATQPLYYQYCPMKKAYWISKTASIRNPYFGKQMVTCGKTTETLPPKGE